MNFGLFNMNSPLITIIIPCFNAQNFLERNLNSIVEQSFPNKEVIIVDGGSTDHSHMIAKNFISKFNFIRWYSEKDKGVYDAMNKGINLAKGDWIYFLGADDVFYHDNVLAEVFSKQIPTKTGLIYGNVEFLYSKMIYNGAFDLKRILFGGNICHQAIFYRKSVFQKLGLFDLECKIYADHDFNIRCFINKQFHIQFIDAIIACYNERDGLSALDKHDSVFRDKQMQYIKAFNRKPIQLIKKAYQSIKLSVKVLVNEIKRIHGSN